MAGFRGFGGSRLARSRLARAAPGSQTETGQTHSRATRQVPWGPARPRSRFRQPTSLTKTNEGAFSVKGGRTAPGPGQPRPIPTPRRTTKLRRAPDGRLALGQRVANLRPNRSRAAARATCPPDGQDLPATAPPESSDALSGNPVLVSVRRPQTPHCQSSRPRANRQPPGGVSQLPLSGPVSGAGYCRRIAARRSLVRTRRRGRSLLSCRTWEGMFHGVDDDRWRARSDRTCL